MLRPALAELDELLFDGAAAEVWMEDGGGIDELGGLLELAGMKVSEPAVAGLEPGSRPGLQIGQSQPLHVDGKFVRFQPVVRVGEVAEQVVRG